VALPTDVTASRVQCPQCATSFDVTVAPAGSAPAIPEGVMVEDAAADPFAVAPAPKPAPAPAPAPASRPVIVLPPPAPVPASAPVIVLPPAAPAPAAPVQVQPPDPFADLGDEPAPKRRRPRDEEDDEDDRPRARRRKREDDEEEDDRPSRRRKRDEEDEAPAPVPAPAPAPEPAPVPVAAANPFAAMGDEPAPKRRNRDEDEDDEDDRPRSRRRKRDEDEDEDDRPSRRRERDSADHKKKRADSGSMVAIFVCVGALLLVCVAVGGYFAFRDSPKPTEEVKNTGPVVPPKKDKDQKDKKDQVPLTRDQMIKKVKGSTVYIRTYLPGGEGGTGSGFFAGKPGYVVTNAHVIGYGPLRVQKPEKVEVVVDSGENTERTLVAKVFGLDAELDLAVLKVEARDLPPLLKFGQAEKLVEAQEVVIFGYPFGETLGKNVSVNPTTVSSLRKTNGSLERVQLAGGLNPGKSGGPVTNAQGEVIGVSVAKFRGTDTIGFAIPAEVADRFVDDMNACGGEIRLGYLQFVVEPKGPNPPKGPNGPGPGPGVKPEAPRWAPMRIPPPKPVALTPPKIAGDTTEVKLSSRAVNACVGGGGRFIIFHLPDEKQLVVFDVCQAKQVGTITAPGRILFTAGMNSLVVVDQDDDTIDRWSLTTFAKESSASLPLGSRLIAFAVAMGSASNGPVLVQALSGPRTGQRFLFDIVAMKEVRGSRTVGELGMLPKDVLRASGDGRTFTHSLETGKAAVIALTDTGFHESVLSWPTAPGGTVPGGDGQTVYAPGRIAGRGAVRAPSDDGDAWTYLPAVHGPLYLALPRPGGDKAPAIHAGRDSNPLCELPPLPALAAVLDRAKAPHIDRHAFFVPGAKALVVLGPDGVTLTVHKLDVDALLDKTDGYLYVTSAPPQAIVGKELDYQLAVKSKKPATGFKLRGGPEGLTVSDAGRVKWDVPATFTKPVVVVVEISDGDGKEFRHEFELIPTLPPPE
jgi:S1-C subfamily serine protease